MGVLGRVRFLGRSPLTIVELIIAIGAIVGGLYVMSPFLTYSTAVNGASPIVHVLGHPVALMVYGAIFVLSGVASIYGIITRRTNFRSSGLFWNMMARTYGLFGTFMVQGLLPFTWWSSAVVLAISVVVYIWLRGLLFRGLID